MFIDQFYERLLVTDDVVWIDPMLVGPARGVEEVRRFMESCWRSMPDLHFDIIAPRCFADGAPVLMVPWK